MVIYQSEDGSVKVDVLFENETVWLSQQQMAMLFQKDISVVSRHIKNIFAEGELDEKSNLHFLQIPNSDKPVRMYSLDVIISVGYRVKSYQGTQFRIWATKRLHELALQKANEEYAKYQAKQLEEVHLESLRELDADLKLFGKEE